MANQVQQLAEWMAAEAGRRKWTLDQCQRVALRQVQHQLPAEQAGRVGEVLFSKAKTLMLRRLFQDQLEMLRDKPGIWTAIKAVFPDATVTVDNGYRKRIIIDLMGTGE